MKALAFQQHTLCISSEHCFDKYDIERSDFAYSARSTKPNGKEEQ